MGVLKRVYVLNDQGQAVPTIYARDSSGRMVEKPGNLGPIATPALVAKNGCDCLTPQQFSASMYNNNSMLPFAVKGAETPDGRAVEFRSEAGRVPGNLQQFSIVVTNTDAASQSVLLGDATGLIAYQLGVAAKDAQLLVTGSYGPTTYELLQKVTGFAALDLHTINVQSLTTSGAADTSFYANATIAFCMADVSGNSAIKKRYNITKLSPNQFLANIRDDESFRFQLGALQAILIENIPTGIAVTLNFQVSAFDGVAGMVKM